MAGRSTSIRRWGGAVVLLVLVVLQLAFAARLRASTPAAEGGHVALLDMKMAILPGTQMYLEESIAQAHAAGARVIIIRLDTPGGMLNTSQEMIQAIFKSPVPIVMYVAPTGATATSAGVFVTVAAHVAAMAPGTSIGAAHPVTGEGKDIEGDMRQKAENMATAMVKSIAAERGRNVAWVERAVKESSSLTGEEAVKQAVADLIAADIDDLLRQLKGRQVTLDGGKGVVLEDFSKLPRIAYEMALREKVVNVLANPNVAALLWLAATTGISIELYNPGAIIPGVVGVISLILALAVTQIIPINQGAIALLGLGALLIGAELYYTTGVLGIGGVIAITLGALYLVDAAAAPGVAVSPELVAPVAILLGLFMLLVARAAYRNLRRRVTTGFEGLIGQTGRAAENFTTAGRVLVNGEIWRATSAAGIIEREQPIEVVAVRDGMVLEVRAVAKSS